MHVILCVSVCVWGGGGVPPCKWISSCGEALVGPVKRHIWDIRCEGPSKGASYGNIQRNVT